MKSNVQLVLLEQNLSVPKSTGQVNVYDVVMFSSSTLLLGNSVSI